MTKEWEAHTVKLCFEGSIISILEAVLWLLILGLRPGLKTQSYGPVPLLLVLEHGTNMSYSPVYTTVRKMDKFSISAIFSHGKVSHWKRCLTCRNCWTRLLKVTVSWHSLLSQLKPYCLTPLLILVMVL